MIHNSIEDNKNTTVYAAHNATTHEFSYNSINEL